MPHSRAAALALQQRIKNRKLPNLNIPETGQVELDRALQQIAEHLRLYEGSGAPKERFVSIEDLERAGLINTVTQGGFATISKVLGGDVPIVKSATTSTRVVISSTQVDNLDGIGNVRTGAKQTRDFLYWNGQNWVPYGLFARDNIWKGRQLFQDGVIDFQERTAGPSAVTSKGYIWLKDDGPNALFFTNDAGLEQLLDPAVAPLNIQNGNYTFVLSDKGKVITKESGGAGETYTIPPNAGGASVGGFDSDAFDDVNAFDDNAFNFSDVPSTEASFIKGTMIGIDNRGGGALSIVITTDTLIWDFDNSTGPRSLADGGLAVILKVGATTWKISGGGLS